jgi:glycosyltransferase involved in cell wall biosynthesis
MLRQFSARDGLRVLYVGSLIPRKSVGTLLEAQRELRDRGYQVSCALLGTGPSEPSLRRLAEALSGDVLFVGEQPPNSLAPWRSAAHVLVLPSLSEGRPYAVLEAMAAGLPVVVTAVPGTRELVQDEVTGLLFPPGDGKALADRLERLISEPDLGVRIGRQARARLKVEGWTVEESARRFIDLSRSLMSEFANGRPHR